jgi:hypothetical protein
MLMLVWHITSAQVEHQVEHLHPESNSPCGTVILQLEEWARLAPVPLRNAECSYTTSGRIGERAWREMQYYTCITTLHKEAMALARDWRRVPD